MYSRTCLHYNLLNECAQFTLIIHNFVVTILVHTQYPLGLYVSRFSVLLLILFLVVSYNIGYLVLSYSYHIGCFL